MAATVLDIKKLITFYPDKIYREMLADTTEMRVALMCLRGRTGTQTPQGTAKAHDVLC